MTKSYKMHSFYNGIKFSCINALKENKWKIAVSACLTLVAIFTGVFIAIKYNNSYELCQLQEISLSDFYNGVAGSSSAFLSRCVSLVVNVSLIVIVSLSPFLIVFAQGLFIYRGYLFGLNFALIFLFYGFGSALTAIVVILPCQIATLAVMILFYVMMDKVNSNCKKFGSKDCNRFLLVVIFLVVMLLLNLAETILLCVLNGKVIMVI